MESGRSRHGQGALLDSERRSQERFQGAALGTEQLQAGLMSKSCKRRRRRARHR